MDTKKSKAILKKINALHESAEAFGGALSKMEKDMILHYLRELYELMLDGSESAFDSSSGPLVESKSSGKSVDFIPGPNETSTAIRTDPVIERQPVHHSNGSTEVIQEVKKVSLDEEVIVEEESIDPELEQLFDLQNLDTNNRFLVLPIADIAKSMGINDRILTINELFGKDQKAFNSCVTKLNGFTAYDQAKDYLITNYAKKFDWTQASRFKKAQVFISLVYRRYL